MTRGRGLGQTETGQTNSKQPIKTRSARPPSTALLQATGLRKRCPFGAVLMVFGFLSIGAPGAPLRVQSKGNKLRIFASRPKQQQQIVSITFETKATATRASLDHSRPKQRQQIAHQTCDLLSLLWSRSGVRCFDLRCVAVALVSKW